MRDLKGTLKAITLELRRELEGKYDAQGNWQAGDLERRLAAIGVRRDRSPVPADELSHLSADDREARRVVDAFLLSRAEAGQGREAATADFVREAAYTWANRLFALRCMETRGLIDEVILQKDAYGGRSLQHQRLARKEPERCTGEDEGLLAVLFDEFARRAEELPLLFDPKSPEVAVRPSVAALKRCIALLSGNLAARGQEPATGEVFTAPDAPGWIYQYWNVEEKSRVFEKVRTKKGAKIEGAEIIPATCIYTDPYIVKFLVQNSLGAMWMAMNSDSRLYEGWAYYVRDADRTLMPKKPVSEISFLDPACGSGHFLIEAFELLYAMYIEEGVVTDPPTICTAILEHNLYGIDIDEHAIQIAALALVMKAKEKAPNFVPHRVNLVATNIRLPAGKEHLSAFLRKHPEDSPLEPALVAIFEGLDHAEELGSLLEIEEPVEKVLRHLKVEYEAAKSRPDQRSLWHELEPARQGRLPLGVEDYTAWKARTLDRLQAHFEAETTGDDLTRSFFGDAGARGLSLVELLVRRYDVVAANPPYMGSKNMGPVLKRHLERHFAAGKRDLYAAFVLRCLGLAGEGGRVAMVTQQSWMFLRSYAGLRARDEEKGKEALNGFAGILRETTIEALAHLGEHAFHDSSAAGAFATQFVLARTEPGPDHRLTAFRLVGPKSPEEKDALLRAALRAKRGQHPEVFRPIQARFLAIPQAPLCYWLRERFFELLAGPTLGDAADVCQGLATSDDARFVRFVWEVSTRELAVSVQLRRWVPFEKGGGYGKWFGHHFWTVDWEQEGARIKAFPASVVRNEQHYFQEGWNYTGIVRGCLGLRLLESGAVFSCRAVSGVFRRGKGDSLMAVLNCRLASSATRAIAQNLQMFEGAVARVPLPERIPPSVPRIEAVCIALKRHLVARDLTERTFAYRPPVGATLTEAWGRAVESDENVAAALHTFEGLSEREVFAAYGVDGGDLAAVLDETGTPAGWFPLIAGYDDLPSLPGEAAFPADLIARLKPEQRRTLSSPQLAELTKRLRALYEAGSGGNATAANEEVAAGDQEEEAEEFALPSAQLPIPAETFVEELSQKLAVHPISVCRLLRELREREGVLCQSERQRFIEDYMSVLVLRLLGHRWPRQVEPGESPPTWADGDGIIPITDGTHERTLLARMQDKLAEDFGVDLRAVEREFEEIIGKGLGEWLATDFFKRHVSQFRKRPIAWKLESTSAGNGKRLGRRAVRKAPAFSCLVYYHRLDADLLPKLRTQYVGPLRTSLQTELAGLEKLKDRTADQDGRRLELEDKIEELKAFDARLEKITGEGFASMGCDALASREPLDKWTSRDSRAPGPTSRDAFLVQEHKYDPDLNDGVRVNIAPLQRAGLLATDVLATKDVEKAIVDRAEWRADERRWCREGKLPRPGWWPNKDGGR